MVLNLSSIIKDDYSLLEPELKQSASGRKILHIAAAENKISRLKQCLARGAEVNVKDGHAKTPLHYAALNNVDDSHFEVAEILLKNGANVNARDMYGNSPFSMLLKKGNAKMIELFLNFEAEIDRARFLFKNVRRNENSDVLQLLIDHGLGINKGDHGKKKTFLHRIAKNLDERDFKIVETLLKNGADVNARDFLGRTPLHILVKYGSMKSIKFFLTFNPDIFILNKRGETLLFSAVFNVDVNVLQFLIDLGIDVNQRNYLGLPVLHIVCNSNKKNILKCLLKNGADINTTNFFGSTPLFKAVTSHSNNLFFFIKHTDFNAVYDNNVLNLYQTLSENYGLKKISRHLVILESLNVPVASTYLTAISKEIEYKNYYNECQKELLRIKTTKFESSWVTFYNLLVDDRKKLKNYAGNEDLIEDLEKGDWENKFPMFGALIEKNVQKGIKRRELFDKSTVMLSKFWPIFNPTHLVIRDVLDCVLGKNDLLKFCEFLE